MKQLTKLEDFVPPIKNIVGEPGDTLTTKQRFEAGKLLIEAKKCCVHGEWETWLDENFGWSVRTAQEWMQYATESQKRGAAFLPPIRQVLRAGKNKTTVNETPAIKETPKTSETWSRPITQKERDEIAEMNAVLRQAAVQAQIERAKHQEQKTLYPLLLEIVHAGYLQLARKAHPDVGGSTEQLQKLVECKQILISRLKDLK